ncbi:hypothetical protein BDZ89DRAFT_1079284 [Hymenopellis radicata]|nr:hypothetical protein BDZ89DRAFT_1079284 [Hymenopellis radicata]
MMAHAVSSGYRESLATYFGTLLLPRPKSCLSLVLLRFQKYPVPPVMKQPLLALQSPKTSV